MEKQTSNLKNVSSYDDFRENLLTSSYRLADFRDELRNSYNVTNRFLVSNFQSTQTYLNNYLLKLYNLGILPSPFESDMFYAWSYLIEKYSHDELMVLVDQSSCRYKYNDPLFIDYILEHGTLNEKEHSSLLKDLDYLRKLSQLISVYNSLNTLEPKLNNKVYVHKPDLHFDGIILVDKRTVNINSPYTFMRTVNAGINTELWDTIDKNDDDSDDNNKNIVSISDYLADESANKGTPQTKFYPYNPNAFYWAVQYEIECLLSARNRLTRGSKTVSIQDITILESKLTELLNLIYENPNWSILGLSREDECRYISLFVDRVIPPKTKYGEMIVEIYKLANKVFNEVELSNFYKKVLLDTLSMQLKEFNLLYKNTDYKFVFFNGYNIFITRKVSKPDRYLSILCRDYATGYVMPLEFHLEGMTGYLDLEKSYNPNKHFIEVLGDSYYFSSYPKSNDGYSHKRVVGNFDSNSDNELENIASRLRKGVTSDLEVYNVSRYFRENNIPERKNNLKSLCDEVNKYLLTPDETKYFNSKLNNSSKEE